MRYEVWGGCAIVLCMLCVACNDTVQLLFENSTNNNTNITSSSTTTTAATPTPMINPVYFPMFQLPTAASTNAPPGTAAAAVAVTLPPGVMPLIHDASQGMVIDPQHLQLKNELKSPSSSSQEDSSSSSQSQQQSQQQQQP